MYHHLTNVVTEHDDYYAELANEFALDAAQHDAHCIKYGWHQNNLRLIAAGRQPNP